MMNRKEFLLKSTMAVFAVSSVGKVVQAGENFVGDCETTNDILGPFYRPEAPTRQDLTSDDLIGSRILLKGSVLENDCLTPIKDALVEIWHCDTEGNYDNESEDFQLRAKWESGDAGTYAFKTILPGKYLNGRLYRPAHIHFRVTAPGYQELISQIYFEGDPHIEQDPWASDPKAERRILPIALEDINGNLAVNFNINLQKL